MELCWEMEWHQVIETKCWFYNVNQTDFFLVGWRLSGTEFIRESIRENFPSTFEITKWGKSHTIISHDYVKPLLERGTKIIFCFADPRDVAGHIGTWRGGQHIHHQDNWGFDILDDRFRKKFLDSNLRKMTEMYDFFYSIFGKNMLTLRYEDAVNNREKFLSQVSEFLGEQPLFIDHKEKYLPEVSIYKPIGIYRSMFFQKDIDQHVKDNIDFYTRWEY